MQSKNFISTIGALLDEVDSLAQIVSLLLFRGQPSNSPLLPKIARDDCKRNSTALEKDMLNELRRRTARAPGILGSDDWDALVVAQHFGMATRLLDWTTNPLIALWFAISNQDSASDGFIYMFPVTDELVLDREKDNDPFRNSKTRVFKPSINNERIAAQSGWFTAHVYSLKSKRFVDLHKNLELKHKVLMKGIRGSEKNRLLHSLDRIGINQESLFPGLEGTCKYVDWKLRIDV